MSVLKNFNSWGKTSILENREMVEIVCGGDEDRQTREPNPDELAKALKYIGPVLTSQSSGTSSLEGMEFTWNLVGDKLIADEFVIDHIASQVLSGASSGESPTWSLNVRVIDESIDIDLDEATSLVDAPLDDIDSIADDEASAVFCPLSDDGIHDWVDGSCRHCLQDESIPVVDEDNGSFDDIDSLEVEPTDVEFDSTPRISR